MGLAPRFHRQAACSGAALIHAHFASGGRSALPLARSLHMPLVVTLHGADVTTRINYSKRYARLWEEADTFVCVSEFIRQKAREAGFPEHKLRVRYTGIDLTAFQHSPGPAMPNLVLFVGRLVEKKGCAYLLRAMQLVQHRYPHARTVIIGEGPLRPALTDLARQLQISCDFLGSQPAAEVRKWLSLARVFCAPSVTAADGDREGPGMVFAEAQSIGTPVASFAHGGIPEIVHNGETGLLAPEGDAERLADNIYLLLTDEQLWRRCVERGRTWISERFDLQRQTRELEEIYFAASRKATRCSSTARIATAR
jgi:glycosyltransferase involved in cell wall biosynthesis